MMHQAWSSIEEVPYCFWRSSVKFQGHMAKKIVDFDPDWAFPDYRPVAAFKSLRFALFNDCMDCRTITYAELSVIAFTSWRHQMETFSALLDLCAGNSPVTGESPSQRPVMRSFMFSLICAWTNGLVNIRDAGDLRCHPTHYDCNHCHYNEKFHPQ